MFQILSTADESVVWVVAIRLIAYSSVMLCALETMLD